jgi:hypothetical protein
MELADDTRLHTQQGSAIQVRSLKKAAPLPQVKAGGIKRTIRGTRNDATSTRLDGPPVVVDFQSGTSGLDCEYGAWSD